MLRHLRATIYIKERVPERIVMKLLGRKTGKMLRVYVNPVDKDVEEVIIQHHGISLGLNSSNGGEIVKYPRCRAGNKQEANYCWRCGYPLHQQVALELEIREKETEEKLKRLLAIIKKYPEILKEL